MDLRDEIDGRDGVYRGFDRGTGGATKDLTWDSIVVPRLAK